MSNQKSPDASVEAAAHVLVPARRLLELGEAERRLEWAAGAVQDFVNGCNADEVFAELILVLTADKYSHDPVNDPLPLTVDEVLTKM